MNKEQSKENHKQHRIETNRFIKVNGGKGGYTPVKNHPTIKSISIIDVIEGEELHDYIKRNKDNLNENHKKIAIIVLKAIEAIEAAHKHKLVHGDIKTENLMIHEDENGNITIKCIDFGLSGIKNRPRGNGTPYYTSPEIKPDGTGAGYHNNQDYYALIASISRDFCKNGIQNNLLGDDRKYLICSMNKQKKEGKIH